MLHRRTLRTLAATTMAVALAGCGSSGSGGSGGSGGSAPKDKVTIVMVQGVTGAPFAQTTAQGGKDAATHVGGVTFSVAGPANIDPAAETKSFQQVVSTRPDGIALQELPPDLFTRLVKDAESSGITVLPYTIAPAAGSSSTTFVGDNGLDLGRMAADRIAGELVRTKGQNVSGKILTGICVPGLSVLQQRIDGFKAEMKKKLPNVEVVAPFDSKSDPSADFAVWQQAVSANPDALAMLSPCEADNQNLVKIKRKSGADWLLTPFDIDGDTLGGVKDGTALAIFPQSSYVHGYVATRLLATTLKAGKKLPKGWVEMPVVPVDKKNVDTIIKRQSSPANQAKFWKPYIDKIFAVSPVKTRPIADANK